jgi:uncharacterized membrane protein
VSAPKPDDDSTPKHRRRSVYTWEATGLLLMAALLLILTLIRYWHYIRWRLR